MSGPRTTDVSAFPGAPGVKGGGDNGPAVPMRTGVVGDNDYLAGGPTDVPTADAFPGYTGDTWQALAEGSDELNPSTVNDQAGHVSGGVRVSHPAAFYPGLGQGV